MAWVKTGTASVVNGSAVVTGTGTNWFGSLQTGWGFVGPDGRTYEVFSVESATQITLASPYMGATAAGQAYAAFPTQSLAHDLTASLQALIGNYQGIYDTVGQGRFAGDAVFDADRDTGMGNPSSNEVGLKAGDVWQLRLKAGAVSGAAVHSDPLEMTAKILQPGSFGLGKSVAIPSGNIDAAVVGGTYHGFGGLHATATAGDNPFPDLNGAFCVTVENLGIGGTGDYVAQTATAVGGSLPGHIRKRVINLIANGWTDWQDVYSAAKEPDVYGSNANGHFLRKSDGTLIMWRDRIAVGITNTISSVWIGTFPATFVGSMGFYPSSSGGNSAENDFGSYLASGRVAAGLPEIRLRHMESALFTGTLYCGYFAIAKWK